MSLSLKEISDDCLSVIKPFSVRRDIFGFIIGSGVKISIKQQLGLIEGLGLNVNIIVVGLENFTFPDLRNIEKSLQIAREIYAKVDLCIRKIRWQQIPVKDAGGFITIDSYAESVDLKDDWRGPNDDFLDVFIVRDRTAAFCGTSPLIGTCSKDEKDRLPSCLVILESGCEGGKAIAHEIGHYLGGLKDLIDKKDLYNFMYFIPVMKFPQSEIYDWQGDLMKQHCYVKYGC